jgi:D-tyrosyl-tRNA(Tyr) deacylase
MNLSVNDIDGEFLIISQFTLYGDTKKGNRPSFVMAEDPEKANDMYEKFLDKVYELSGKKPQKGVFGADMKVELLNDGPVTIILDSKDIMPNK